MQLKNTFIKSAYQVVFGKGLLPLCYRFTQINQTKVNSETPNPFQPENTNKFLTQKRSIDNVDKKCVYAMYLPKEWDESKIKEGLDPNNMYISKVKIVKDLLGCSTGEATLFMKSEQTANLIIKKFSEEILDTQDVMQRIVVRAFKLKKMQEKSCIERKLRQAYISGLPRDMLNEQLLDLVVDFGEIENVQIPRDNDQSRNKGYAFVLFKHAKEAQQFQQFMSGKQFLDKKLRVQLKDFQFDSQKKRFTNKSDFLVDQQNKTKDINYRETIRNLDQFEDYIKQMK